MKDQTHETTLALAWLEDYDRMVYDTHTYEAVGMSMDERRRDAYESMRGLTTALILAGVAFLVVAVFVYASRVGGG